MKLRDIEEKILAGEKLREEDEKFLAKRVTYYWESHPDVANRFPRWRKYIAWVAGYQLVDYNRLSKQLVDLSQVPGIDKSKKVVFNKLRPFVRQLTAKLCADTPTTGIVPNTNEDEDIEAAKVGDKLIEALSEKIHVLDQVNDLKSWVVLINRGFFRVYWNRDDYGVLGHDTQTMPDTVDAQGNTTPGEEKMVEIRDEGDVMIESVSPFNCRVDTLYSDSRRWRWFIYGELADAEELERTYKLKDGTIKDDSETLQSAYDLTMTEDVSNMGPGGSSDKDINGRTCVFKELWTQRIFCFLAGDTVVEYGPNPYGEIPFYSVEDRLVPIDNYEKGYPYNESLLKDAIPIQREFNRHMGVVGAALERASKIKVMNPLGSIVSKKHFTSDLGVFIDFNPRSGGTPYQLKLEPLPAFTPMYKTDLEREFENTFSAHEASFGRLPERASHASGTLMNLLVEQDDIVLNPLLSRVNNALQAAWRLALRIVQENYSVARIIKYVGDDNSTAALKFRGSDLHGNTDVRCVSQAGLPHSRALRIEYVMKLRSEGLITDDKQSLELLQFGNVEKLFQDSLLHEKVASRENAKIFEDQRIDPSMTPSWVYYLDEHPTHLKIHLRFRLGSRWEKLNQAQKQALEAHIEATYQALMMAQQPQQAQQQSSPQQAAQSGNFAEEGMEQSGGMTPEEMMMAQQQAQIDMSQGQPG